MTYIIGERELDIALNRAIKMPDSTGVVSQDHQVPGDPRDDLRELGIDPDALGEFAVVATDAHLEGREHLDVRFLLIQHYIAASIIGVHVGLLIAEQREGVDKERESL